MMQRHGRIERVADHIGKVVAGEAARLGEPVGMHEDNQAQLFAAGEDLAEALGREILAGDMGHDLDTAKDERFMQSIELGDREIGGLERHRAETDKTVGITAADLGDEVVDGARGFVPEIGVGAVVGLARRRRDRLDVDPHPVHILDPLFGRGALEACPFSVLAVDGTAALVRRGFEKPLRDGGIAFDHRRRLVAADMAMDVDREPFAAGMHRTRETPGNLRPRRQTFEQHLGIPFDQPDAAGISMFSSRAALRPRIARRSASSRPAAPSTKPIGSISPMSAGEAVAISTWSAPYCSTRYSSWWWVKTIVSK